MESTKYTNNKAVQQIQELDFGEYTCNINQYIKKRMQNNDISEILNMERQDISSTVNQSHASKFSVRIYFCKKKLCQVEKNVLKERKFKVMNVQHYLILQFNEFT